MPFSSTRDAEHYWRSRFGGPAAKNVSAFPGRKGGPGGLPGGLADSETAISPAVRGASFREMPPVEKAPRGKKRLFRNSFPALRRKSLRAASVLGLGGLAVAVLAVSLPGGKRAPAPVPEAAEAARPAASFASLLQTFLEAHEASIVALRGLLLTDGDGFRSEWLDATRRKQAALDALDADSASWTDGKRLVELEEAKRIAARLLAEERAVAAIAGTANRYPGLQLFREDILPALGEAQEIASAAMSSMLAVSTPDNVGPVGPFAAFRGDLETMREELTHYVAVPAKTSLPPSANEENFDAWRRLLVAVQADAPGEAQPKIDRLIELLTLTQEKLQRIVTLKQGERWDYASFAFQTRVMPLAARLDETVLGWKVQPEAQMR